MRATMIRPADEEGMDALIEIQGVRLEVMDSLLYHLKAKPGDEIEVQLKAGLCDEDEDLDAIFTANPQCEKKLTHLQGWSYRAYGEIIALDPVIIDCGIARFSDVLCTHDERCLGEFIAWTIIRLDVWAA